MKDSKKDESAENIFKIMDEVIYQLNKTKKLFIIMILSFMIILPSTFLITFAIFDPPFERGVIGLHNGPIHGFFPLRIIPTIVVLVWLGIGIRQWFILSKWTQKYELYKELQKKLDEKLADEEKSEADKNRDK